MIRREIFVRYDRCVGCHSCELACAISHTAARDLFGAILGGEKAQKLLWVDQVGPVKAPAVCRHCEDAPCVAVCPTGAMHRREDGLNLVNLPQCIGCWMCALACPFGAVSRGDGKAIKCDRECLDEEGVPACVRACPTGALVFKTVEEFEADRRREGVTSLK
ncbi:4Fe-4S dicluster domain-containing protein [Thermodesulfobacterium thermophilum]|uniref:4Fe-4S dicluster domain-containing protein n=1 Tax=Thermodesulfobacterium thermophilum TaxID=886 RepID=UPI0003B743E6|nr:4Fe-4S dicluster domain-containing protein [Thermodesulfobacterium thermophilum]